MIYTSVDLGSNFIKIVVSEHINDKYYVIASTKIKSIGIKKGIITDKELLLKRLLEGIDDINTSLGIRIKEVLVNIPLVDVNTTIEVTEDTVGGIITGSDIQNILKKVVKENIPKNMEVVYLEPIVFNIDGNLQVVDPKGITATEMEVRCVISTVEKKFLYDYFEIFMAADLEIVDFTYSIVGDYFENTNSEANKSLGVVVNFGYDKTEVGIFNKGILLKGRSLPIGSKKIDKDLSYIYKMDRNRAREIKEGFGVASSKFADSNDIMEISNVSGEKININQLEVSQIIEARLLTIIKSVKNTINGLTNREISYIIITGGITELSGFLSLIEEEFNCDKIIGNVLSLGIRNNIYSSSLGLIKYFDKKMKFRNIEYSMLSEDDKKELTSKKKNSAAMENLLSKFSAYLKS